MTCNYRSDHGTRTLMALLLGGLIILSAPAGADTLGKVIVDMEEPVPPHSAVRVGYVDYGYPEIPSGELDFATSPFSPFQKRLLLALTNQEGLLFDIVGAAEVSAFASFLENQQEHQRMNKSQNDYEFGNSKKTEAEKYEDFDLRMLFDADAWNACEYEFHVVLSAW